jgi:hypothetical protein
LKRLFADGRQGQGHAIKLRIVRRPLSFSAVTAEKKFVDRRETDAKPRPPAVGPLDNFEEIFRNLVVPWSSQSLDDTAVRAAVEQAAS